MTEGKHGVATHGSKHVHVLRHAFATDLDLLAITERGAFTQIISISGKASRALCPMGASKRVRKTGWPWKSLLTQLNTSYPVDCSDAIRTLKRIAIA